MLLLVLDYQPIFHSIFWFFDFFHSIFVILVGFFVACLISLPAVYINSIGGEDNHCVPRYTPLSFHLFYFELYLFTLPVLIPFLINIVVSSITFLYLRKTQININQNNYKKSKSLFKTVYLNLVFLITYFTPFIIKIIFYFLHKNWNNIYTGSFFRSFDIFLLFKWLFYLHDCK